MLVLVPILESWGLPQPDTNTNDGINSWIQQVIGTYTTGNTAVLAYPYLSMYKNAQLLNSGTMDLLLATCQTYINDSSRLQAQYNKS